MGPRTIGVLIGLAIAVADYLVLRALAARVELDETKRVLKITGLSQFVLLPLMGFFLAPLFTGD